MKIKIDQKKLLEMNACEDGIIDFNKIFPEGVELDTEKTYVFEEDHEYVEWLFEKLKINFKTPDYEYNFKNNITHFKHSNGYKFLTEYDENGNEIRHRNISNAKYENDISLIDIANYNEISKFVYEVI